MLVNHILEYIYNNFGICNDFVSTSIVSEKYLLTKKIKFEGVDGNEWSAKMYGAEIVIDKLRFRILCGDFSSEEKEYALIVKLDNCPSYGCYLIYNSDLSEISGPQAGLLAFSIKENEWLASNVYIQATFLAGMEQLRDVSASWQSLSNYQDMIENMKSYVRHYDSIYGD